MSRVNAACFARMVAALMEQPQTMHELCEETGLQIRCLQRYVGAMRRAGACYIARWELDSRSRPIVPAYMLGGHADAKRRPPKSATEATRAWRARRRAAELLGLLRRKRQEEVAA